MRGSWYLASRFVLRARTRWKMKTADTTSGSVALAQCSRTKVWKAAGSRRSGRKKKTRGESGSFRYVKKAPCALFIVWRQSSTSGPHLADLIDREKKIVFSETTIISGAISLAYTTDKPVMWYNAGAHMTTSTWFIVGIKIHQFVYLL